MRPSIVFVLLSLTSLLPAQSVGGFSPVPFWPSSGTPTEAQRYGSYVFLDAATQEYVLYYPEELGTNQPLSGRMTLLRIQLQDRSIPSISVLMSRDATGKYRYTYTLSNGARAKSAINSWALVAAATDDSVQLSHQRWKAIGNTINKPAIAPQSLNQGPELRKSATMGKFVRWFAPDEQQIAANKSETDFAAVSDFRPGWTLAYVAGGDGIRLPGSVPPEVLKQLEELQKPENYYTPAVTIGPKYGPKDTDHWIANDWNLFLQKKTVPNLSYIGTFLDASSPLVKEVKGVLAAIMNGSPASGMALTQPPKTQLEKELADGIRLSLGLK